MVVSEYRSSRFPVSVVEIQRIAETPPVFTAWRMSSTGSRTGCDSNGFPSRAINSLISSDDIVINKCPLY